MAQANAEHKDKPVDTGNRRLPAGIRDGVAKLSAMYTKAYEDDKNGPGTKGQSFFRVSAIVVSPETHNGEKTAGQVTSQVVPLCDMPAKGQRKAIPFSQNWFEFQNIFKLLGVAPCPETPATDPTGQRTEVYFFAAMKMLTDPERIKADPKYISFSTRGWTPPASPAQPKPEEMVFETWHGLAAYNGKHDPAAGVRDSLPPTQTAPAQAPAPPVQPSHTPPSPQYQPGGDADPADVVAALVEVAMNDPEGATEEGQEASSKLEGMAWAAGWTKEQTAGAADWAQVGDMALNKPTAGVVVAPPTPVTVVSSIPTVGMRCLFAKRTKDGERLKNNKGEVFPPQDVEVVTVDGTTGTCTLKTVKDGKDVVDIRTKKPIAVKFEWLEPK